MRTYHSRFLVALSTAFLCFLLTLLSACSSPFTSPSPGSQGKTNQGNGTPAPFQTASPTSQPPQVQTSCPAAGTARAAIMPSMALGMHQTVVYAWNPANSSTGGILRRYDTMTRSKTDIVVLPNAQIFWAQISKDGQWIFFLSHRPADYDAIQLVRLDGQYLQTLYCQAGSQDRNPVASIATVSLSPNQKTLVFTLENGTDDNASMIALDLAHGTLQTIVNGLIFVETWFDDSHLIAETNPNPFNPSNPPTIYLVDITQHNQQVQAVQVIRKEQTNCFGVANSLNSNILYVWEWACSGPSWGWRGPSVIRSVPVFGTLSNGWPELLMTDNGRAINPVISLNQHSVFYVADDGTTPAKTSLWKVGTDGRGNATQLFTADPGQSVLLNPFSHFTWSDFSRDGTMYAVEIRSATTEALNIGSVNGSNSSVIAHDNSVGNLTVAGWTTF